jgi:hypothetical protein
MLFRYFCFEKVLVYVRHSRAESVLVLPIYRSPYIQLMTAVSAAYVVPIYRFLSGLLLTTKVNIDTIVTVFSYIIRK